MFIAYLISFTCDHGQNMSKPWCPGEHQNTRPNSWELDAHPPIQLAEVLTQMTSICNELQFLQKTMVAVPLTGKTELHSNYYGNSQQISRQVSDFQNLLRNRLLGWWSGPLLRRKKICCTFLQADSVFPFTITLKSGSSDTVDEFWMISRSLPRRSSITILQDIWN